MSLVERVAVAMNLAVPLDGSPVNTKRVARAAISEVLDAVEAHLLAVQYDPAPYTALKHRLAQLRKEALGE